MLRQMFGAVLLVLVSGCLQTTTSYKRPNTQGSAASPPTQAPRAVTKERALRIVPTLHGFCQVRRDGQLRCRELLGAHDGAAADPPPAGSFRQIVRYINGFCALSVAGDILCWTDGHAGAHRPKIKFSGEYKEIAASPYVICGLKDDQTIDCGWEDTNRIEDERPIFHSQSMDIGRVDAIHSGRSLCAVQGERITCANHPREERTDKGFSTYKFGSKNWISTSGEWSKSLSCHSDQFLLSSAGVLIKRTYGFEDKVMRGAYKDVLCSAALVCLQGMQGEWSCEGDTARADEPIIEASLWDGRGAVIELVGLTKDGRLIHPNKRAGVREGFVTHHSAAGTTCAIRADDTVYCAGSFEYDDDAVYEVTTIEAEGPRRVKTDKGAFGAGTFIEEPYTREIGPPPARGLRDIQRGAEYACGLNKRSQAVCWGQIHGSKHLVTPPKDPLSVMKVGVLSACGLTSAGGEVRCWGHDAYRYMRDMPKGGGFVSLTATHRQLCAQHQDGRLLCWGGVFIFMSKDAPFELPYRPDRFVLVDGGICVIHPERRDVECFGRSVTWSR
jgi:hypothetical protein